MIQQGGGVYPVEIRTAIRGASREHASFWFFCLYIIFEYVRPHSIVPSLNVIPWAQTFILLAGALSLIDPTARLPRCSEGRYLIGYSACVVLSSLFAQYPEASAEHLADYFSWVVVFFVFIRTVNNRRRLLIVLLIYFAASAKLSFSLARTWAMRGFSFEQWGLSGPPGFFQNSGELSIQMLMFLPTAYFFSFARREVIPKLSLYTWLMLPITAAMTIMGASSRGSQLGLIAQAGLIFMKNRIQIKSIAIFALAGVIGLNLLPDEQKKRFESIGEDKTSQQRLLYWKNGAKMIIEYPAFGVGFFNFVPYYEKYYSEDRLYKHAQLPHNIFVQAGTDTGLIGLFAYIGFILASYRSGKLIEKHAERCAEASKFYVALGKGLNLQLLGFVVAGQFVSVVYYPFLWINAAFTVATLQALQREPGLQDAARPV